MAFSDSLTRAAGFRGPQVLLGRALLPLWLSGFALGCTASDAGSARGDEAQPATAANDAGIQATMTSDLADAGHAGHTAVADAEQQPVRDAGSAPLGPMNAVDAGLPDPGSRDAEPRDAPPGDGGASEASTSSTGAGECGRGMPVETPFGCRFAWGSNDPVTSLPNAERLGFVSKWVGHEVDKSGALSRCDGCSWLPQLKSGGALPVYYAYFIGFLGSANGFADQNVNPNGPNLATDGAQLIRAQRKKLIDMYGSYAKQSARVWSDKPLIWLLEGDFVQYTYKEQKQALSLQELAVLARDISCAIKSNMPNAVVAINHTTWLSDELTNAFWQAMASAGVDYDLVWTTGVANNMGFFERDAKSGIYNQATATYAYVARKTGRKILVDTSFGLSSMSDTWATATPATLNARIAEGVIAANVTMPASNYVAMTQALSSQLNSVCNR